MVPLYAAYLPPNSFIGRPLVSSAGWAGHLSPAQPLRHATQERSLRNATQNLGFICPFARRSTRSSTQLACANPPCGHGTGTRMRISPDPAADSSRASPQHVHAVSASSLALLLACWFVARFGASSTSEIADRHDPANCLLQRTPHSEAAS